ncbi:MAG: GGDEF domain-containing protein [Burkholderiaceae bacterium]
MSQVVDHLAELTGFRDRDILDTTLVGVLRDLLRPLAVAICHVAGEEPNQHWLTRARIRAGDIAAESDPAWVELDALPALDAFPGRLACLRQQEPFEEGGATHKTYFPLLTDRDVIGVLEIESGADLDAEQLRMVSNMLRIYRNVQGLLDYSERDSLTGLLNRKTFDDTFYKTTSPAAAASQPADERRAALHERLPYLGVVDIDHFKAVNDQHGHLIGDEVLLLLSRLMRASFRFHDRLYRFGGEEFVVLLRCGDDEQARAALERLRAATESYPFPQVGQITVSIGFTRVGAADSPVEAFERADRAVYWAKSHGRNCVASYSTLVQQGEITEDHKRGDVELF